MYAIIQTGNKQYRVEEGNMITIDRTDIEEGNQINFDSILLIGENDQTVKIGMPFVDGANVTGKVLYHHRGKKITIFKRRTKTGYRKKQGHRQNYTRVEITEIKA